jgi:hypothetical protein
VEEWVMRGIELASCWYVELVEDAGDKAAWFIGGGFEEGCVGCWVLEGFNGVMDLFLVADRGVEGELVGRLFDGAV